jgi:hypothetical protein
MHRKTLQLIEAAKAILQAHNPMTARQCYYQLVSAQVIRNCESSYNAVLRALMKARLEGLIPWEWIEDRLRRPRGFRMYESPQDWADGKEYSYLRNVWATQPYRIELWCEKDALSGVFSDAQVEYRTTLHVGRGYDSWSAIHDAAQIFDTGEDVVILYFGDFDPSVEDMFRSLRERLGELDCHPCQMVKCALTLEDIELYGLPPNFTKTSDSRGKKHIERYGAESSVELDALPMHILQQRIVESIERWMDLEALAETKAQEWNEQKRIREMLEAV